MSRLPQPSPSARLERARDSLIRLTESTRPTLILFRVSINALGVILLVSALAGVKSLLVGMDAISYWLIDPANLYRWTERSDSIGPFRYSPVVGQVLDPLGLLGWGAFQALFLALCLGALVVLGGRVGLALLMIPWVLGEVLLGNIDLFLAVSLGLGVFFPPAWAFLILTKFTPGIVVLWFVARGEWRKLALVAAVTIAIALPSILVTPNLWVEWFKASQSYALTSYGLSAIPVVPRLAVAAMVVVIGARKNWLWTIAVAGTLAMPGLDWKTATVALSILPLLGLGLSGEWRRGRFRAAPIRPPQRPGPREPAARAVHPARDAGHSDPSVVG